MTVSLASADAGVRYSGHTGKDRPKREVQFSKRSPRDISEKSANAKTLYVPKTSPVLVSASILFVTAFLLHDFSFAIAIVAGQLIGMTAAQRMALTVLFHVQKRLQIIVSPLKLLRIVRKASLWIAFAWVFGSLAT